MARVETKWNSKYTLSLTNVNAWFEKYMNFHIYFTTWTLPRSYHAMEVRNDWPFSSTKNRLAAPSTTQLPPPSIMFCVFTSSTVAWTRMTEWWYGRVHLHLFSISKQPQPVCVWFETNAAVFELKEWLRGPRPLNPSLLSWFKQALFSCTTKCMALRKSGDSMLNGMQWKPFLYISNLSKQHHPL